MSSSAPHPLNVEPTGGEVPVDFALEGAPAPHPVAGSPPASAPPPPRGAPGPHTPDRDVVASMWLDPGAARPIRVREAVAVLVPTEGHNIRGVVRFREDGHVLHVSSSVYGLPGPVHAYHVHVFGDCSSPDGESAGPHFNFSGSSFDQEVGFITGDLGELRPNRSLLTSHRTRIRASLQGRYSLIGRAVVVHAQRNDPSAPPDGAAGKRLACGVIGVTGPLPAPATAHHP